MGTGKKTKVAAALFVGTVGILLNSAAVAVETGRVKDFARESTRAAQFPLVSMISGKAVWTDKEGNDWPIQRSEKLVFRAIIKTEGKAQLRIELDKESSLIVFENTQVEFPVISWEEGRLEKIVLHWGRVGFDGRGDSSQVMETPISQSIIEKGKYLVTYDPTLPRVKMSVIDGELAFRGLENEKSVDLTSGQEAQFRGHIDSGEVQFDVLLRGRKVAKGHLDPMQKMAAEQLAEYKKLFDMKKEIAKSQQKKVKRIQAQICADPFGEFNQCAWYCDNKKKACAPRIKNTCIRVRCNANGEWSDRRELTALESRCSLKPTVGTCED